MAKILVVDDSIVIRELIKEWLQEEGHEIAGEAQTGEEAVRKFKELRPDITTLDIAMPVMHGVDALVEIKAIDPDASVLMVSAEGKKNGNIPQALILGACEFIEKPFEKDVFLSTIAKIDKRMKDTGHA